MSQLAQRGKDQTICFVWEDGRPLRPDWVSRRFKTLVDSSGLPLIPLHGLRHSHATALLRAGVHPKIVRRAGSRRDQHPSSRKGAGRLGSWKVQLFASRSMVLSVEPDSLTGGGFVAKRPARYPAADTRLSR